MHKTLTLANLPLIDNGRVELAFNAALRRVIDDITDRPKVTKDRVILLKVIVNPKAHDESGLLLGGNVQFQITDSVPKRQTTFYPMNIGAKGLLFQPESPDDPNQQVLSDLKIDKTTGEVADE